VSDCRRMSPSAELGVTIGPSGKEPQPELPVRRPIKHLGQHRWGVVVTDDEVVAGPRIDRQPCVSEVGVDDTGLVFLVVIDPQLN